MDSILVVLALLATVWGVLSYYERAIEQSAKVRVERRSTQLNVHQA